MVGWNQIHSISTVWLYANSAIPEREKSTPSSHLLHPIKAKCRCRSCPLHPLSTLICKAKISCKEEGWASELTKQNFSAQDFRKCEIGSWSLGTCHHHEAEKSRQTSVLSRNTESILITSYCLVQNTVALAWQAHSQAGRGWPGCSNPWSNRGHHQSVQWLKALPLNSE